MSGYIPCECQLEKVIASRVPARYVKASIADFPRGWQKAALDWLPNPKDGLLITGKAGTGKTHLACGLMRLLITAKQDAHFVSCADLYSEVAQAYHGEMGEKYLFDRYAGYKFLFLDDLGAGNLSDHERRATLRILDGRLNALKPTCVTMNWSLPQVAERMDERIASRLSSFTALELMGKDWRV